MKKLIATLALVLAIAAALLAWDSNLASAATPAPHDSHGLALSAIPQTTPMPAMVPFSSKDGAFSLKMPGVPKQESQKVDTAVGPMIMYTFTVEANAGKFAYLAQYSDFP